MAEEEQQGNNSPHSPPQRRPYHHQNRASSSYRGRGRGNPSVNKALHLFGVRDLREILDRKHQEQDEERNRPPPDSSYSYLKDPARENTSEQRPQRYQKNQHSEFHHRGHSFRGSRGRGRGGPPKQIWHSKSEKASYMQNLVNIKVEVSASTGERSYQIDEETKLADIKHVPNYKLKDLRPPRREDSEGKEFTDRYRSDRGRGRGHRGRRGRGRGVRGQGRGGSMRNDENQEHSGGSKLKAPDVTSEENWDTECAVKENEEDKDETYEDDHGAYEDGHEDEHGAYGDGHEDEHGAYGDGHEEEHGAYGDTQEEHEAYVEGEDDFEGELEAPYTEEGTEEEFSDANRISNSQEEGIVRDNVKIEENLVVTSSKNKEKCKRSVTFKDNDQATKLESGNDGKVVEKHASKTEVDEKLNNEQAKKQVSEKDKIVEKNSSKTEEDEMPNN